MLTHQNRLLDLGLLNAALLPHLINSIPRLRRNHLVVLHLLHLLRHLLIVPLLQFQHFLSSLARLVNLLPRLDLLLLQQRDTICQQLGVALHTALDKEHTKVRAVSDEDYLLHTFLLRNEGRFASSQRLLLHLTVVIEGVGCADTVLARLTAQLLYRLLLLPSDFSLHLVTHCLQVDK